MTPIQQFRWNNLILKIITTPWQRFAVMILLVFLSYGNIFHNDFVADDIDFIVNWSLIQDVHNLPRFFFQYITPEGQGGIYSPLRTLLFCLNYSLWQEQTAGWHLFSLFIHLLGVWLTYRIAQLLVKNQTVAFLTAGLFAVYPLHTEAISYITASVDTTGVVFYLAAFYFFAKAIGVSEGLRIKNAQGADQTTPPNQQTTERPSTTRDYALSLIFAALAIFTHELCVSLPFLFFFFALWFSGAPQLSKNTKTGGKIKTLAMRTLPFFAMTLLYVLAKIFVLGEINRGRYLYDNFYLTMLVVAKAWFKYIVLSFVPVNMSFDQVIAPGIFAYDQKDFHPAAVLAQSWHDPLTLAALLSLLLAGIWAVWQYRRQPLHSFCVGWFFICLLPCAQFIPSSVFFAERYLYAGSFAFCLLLSAWLYRGYHSQRRIFGITTRALSIILTIGLIVFYSGRTFTRNPDFRDQISLYESVVRTNSQSGFMQNNLAVSYAQQGLFEQALPHFEQAIKLNPREPHFYFSLANAYAQMKNPEEAIANLKKAIALNPEFAEAYFNMAGAYVFLGDLEQARRQIDTAVELFKKQGRVLEAGEYKMILEDYISKPMQPPQTPQN